jgi:transcriptional regulator with PAS, ATPase and Fis domain
MPAIRRDPLLASKLVARSDSEVRGGVIVMQPAYAPAGPRRAQGRATERRRGAGELLRTVTSGLSATREVARVRERFEEEIRTLVRARSIAVCDGALAAPPDPNVLVVDIPADVPPQRPRLEAVFEPGRSLDGWTCQMLESASHVAALLLEIERAQRRAPLFARVRGDGAAPLIGSSPAIRQVRERIERVAATDFTVLIEGESGTGKELVARQIHDLSRRRKGPFVAVNCAAIVETLLEAELFGIEDRTATGVRGRRGKFEHAHEGTLFLDEVSDLSPAAQAKLLRAIQDLSVERVGGSSVRHIDTRIIVATNRPLAEMVEHRRFRLDLYYRLNGIDVQVPPLRARRDDVLELARYFLDRHHLVRPLQLSAAAIDALLAYDWPGNVRELERVIERAVALAGSGFLELDDLPPALLGGYGDVLLPSLRAKETMRAWGSRYARLVLERCRNNKRQACRELGISYHTLRSYLSYRPAPAHQDIAKEEPAGD